MKFIVDACMNTVLGDTQLSGDEMLLHYSSVCHDDVMNLGNGLQCDDSDWPSRTGVIFQTLPVTFEFSIPLLDHAVWRGILP